MRRIASSSSAAAASSLEDSSHHPTLGIRRHLDDIPCKSSLDESETVNGSSTAYFAAGPFSPLWGEPGRKLPSVSSMLLLPPLASPTNRNFPEDIEDLGKEDKEREGRLIEELVQASPRVDIEFSKNNTNCSKCHRSSKFMYMCLFVFLP